MLFCRLCWGKKSDYTPTRKKQETYGQIKHQEARPSTGPSTRAKWLPQKIHKPACSCASWLVWKGATYCWWKKSCTSWYGKYPIIYRAFAHPRWCRISSINSSTWKFDGWKLENDLFLLAFWDGICSGAMNVFGQRAHWTELESTNPYRTKKQGAASQHLFWSIS